MCQFSIFVILYEYKKIRYKKYFLMIFSRESFDLVETRSDAIRSCQVLGGFFTAGTLFPCSVTRQQGECLRRNDSGD